MSAELLGTAFKAEMGSHVAKLVLLKLVDAADDDGTNIWPAIATIAKAAQAHERTVQKFLRLFQRVDLLQLVAKGGSGPGHTNRYRLNLAMLHKIRQLGWDKATGVGGQDDDLEEGGATPPMASEAGDGISDDKGGASGHPTPPLDPSRERERAREVGKEADPEARRLWLSLRADYPGAAKDNLAEAEGLFMARTAAAQRKAIDSLPAWKAFLGPNPKRRVTLQDYIRDARWDLIPADVKATAAKAAAPETVFLDAFGRAWWWMFGRQPAGPFLRKRIDMARGMAIGWPVPADKAAEIEAAAERDLTQYPKDGEHARAWRSYWRTLGVDMPTPDKADWVFLPTHGPPEIGNPMPGNHQFAREGAG